jgi:hypothetical protein
MTTPQAGDHVSLHELEINVRTELTLAETGQPGGEYVGVPDEGQWPDPDTERYETALRSLLGAVETLEQGGKGDRWAMRFARQHTVDMLRIAGLPALADEARVALPDPVEDVDVARFLARYGITKDELISRRGGSP